MEVFKSFRLFGLYFYVSSIRMKRRRTIDEKMRNKRKLLQKKKAWLYRQQGGCCFDCGRRFEPYGLEIHHLVGVSENADLAFETKNMVLLCPDCHVKVHREIAPPDEI